jgi:diguanylate cyclase (GGDEF)-like protein
LTAAAFAPLRPSSSLGESTMLRELEAQGPSEAGGAHADDAARAGRPRPLAASIALVGAAEVAAQLERQLVQCRRHRGAFGLVCVGVEHVEGLQGEVDASLERRVRDEVAHRIASRIRASDRLLRESERDSVVLLPGGSADAAERVVERFVRALNGSYRIDDALLRVRVRVGCAACPGHGSQAAELLRRASERLCG